MLRPFSRAQAIDTDLLVPTWLELASYCSVCRQQTPDVSHVTHVGVYYPYDHTAQSINGFDTDSGGQGRE